MSTGCRKHWFEYWVVAPCGKPYCGECHRQRSAAKPRKAAQMEATAADMRARYLTGRGAWARARGIEKRLA